MEGRAIVVFETMRPSMPLRQNNFGNIGAGLIVEVGRDLQQERHAARQFFARFDRVRSSSASSSDLFCRPRKPGVFGEEMLTVT